MGSKRELDLTTSKDLPGSHIATPTEVLTYAAWCERERDRMNRIEPGYCRVQHFGRQIAIVANHPLA